MAATHTVTSNPQLITVSGTTDNSIDLSAIIKSGVADILIEWVSGTTVKFNTLGATEDDSGTLTESRPKKVLAVKKRQWLYCKGGAGSETFEVSAISK